MNGRQWNLRMRVDRRILVLVQTAIILSLVLGTAIRVQGQATSADPSGRVSAPGGTPVQNSFPAAWGEGVKGLAAKIATAVKPARVISLEVKNISSLGAAEVEAIQKGLEAELRSRGMKVGAAEASVTVTLSENVDGYVWVAEIRTEGSSRVEMLGVAKPADAPTAAKPIPVLQRRIVWRQKDPILDFATPDYAPPLFELSSATVLEPTRVREFRPGYTEWSGTKSAVIPAVRGPRDLRGFLVPNREGGMTAYEGKEACFGLFLSPQCGESSSQAWPLSDRIFARFFGSRNYFLGFTRDSYPFLQDRPFYSVAIGTNVFDHSTPIITTELDGAAHSYSDIQIVEAVFGGWGDDIATIKPSCGFSWQILVTGTGDWTEPDYIQVYGISFGVSAATAKKMGQPLEFPGPILALWQADDETSARVASKNLQTGMYEASIVTVSCSQ